MRCVPYPLTCSLLVTAQNTISENPKTLNVKLRFFSSEMLNVIGYKFVMGTNLLMGINFVMGTILVMGTGIVIGTNLVMGIYFVMGTNLTL